MDSEAMLEEYKMANPRPVYETCRFCKHSKRVENEYSVTESFCTYFGKNVCDAFVCDEYTEPEIEDE